MPKRWRTNRSTTTATTASTATAATRGWTIAVSATLAIRAAGIFFDIHFFKSGMTPTIRILLFNLEQLFIPSFVGKSSSLPHYVIDFLALSSGVTGVINPSMGRLPIHAQFTRTSRPSARRGRTPPESAHGGHVTVHPKCPITQAKLQ